MLLHPNPVPATQFTWVPAERLFVAEASEVGGFGRVWDDACDEGLTLISRHDASEVVFAIHHEQRDGEGDILYWDLRPARLAGQAVGFAVRIFND